MGIIGDSLGVLYPWIKAFHIMSVLSWMAGLFYLPRLFVHHVEQAEEGSKMDETFQMMELKLFRVIMGPAMIATWVFGICLVLTPGVVDWGTAWPWVKAACVIMMSWFHGWLGAKRKEIAAGTNKRTGRTYRLMNEVPTVLMILIVISVVVKY